VIRENSLYFHLALNQTAADHEEELLKWEEIE